MTAHRNGSKVSWSKARKIILRDGQRCRYCGVYLDLEDITFDHIKPHAHGGREAIENLVTCCGTCNNGFGSSPVKSLLPQSLNMKDVLYLIRRLLPKQNTDSKRVVLKKRKDLKRKIGRLT